MKNLQTLSCDDGCLARSDSIFKHLSKEELDLVTFEKTVEQFKRGSVIYRESSRINGCYCIQKGIVKVFKTGIDGKEQIIRFAQAGDIIGFRSVLSSELACTTAEVLDDAYTCYIPSETLVHLVKNNGNFSMDLMQITCKELGEANAYITDIAQKTVRERLAEILIHLKKDFGLDDNKVLQISLTREELANIVGTATESVIRLLSEFKQDQLIELNGRKIKILDEPGLIRIGNLYE
ncbi:MAG TPA: Crp/Fnr family transcriptional regulator [Bacteroides sp.]|nr:Crp/Fnr family transcriptional regulator [Bacteroides sp.]